MTKKENDILKIRNKFILAFKNQGEIFQYIICFDGNAEISSGCLIEKDEENYIFEIFDYLLFEKATSVKREKGSFKNEEKSVDLKEIMRDFSQVVVVHKGDIRNLSS